MTEIRVLAPGLLTTVQDLGRPGYAHLGISASGAADALSLRVGNLLVGNSPRAAALEMTLTGGTFEFSRAATIALTGSPFETSAPWSCAFDVQPGETLRLGPTRAGARCYLCVRGGLSVPAVLGSASTHVLTALGGLEGRSLKKGDVLCVGDAIAGPPHREVFPVDSHRDVVRVTEGPQHTWFEGSLDSGVYQVAEESNRMGLRLDGPALPCARQLLTEGVSLGAIQVPPQGQPIITFVEHQTTGGYPKIANVISADLPVVGQLRPRDRVRFEYISIARALELLREQEASICSLI
jgi:5-oxoprolinase (ATP-hydrolysing) subunit C